LAIDHSRATTKFNRQNGLRAIQHLALAFFIKREYDAMCWQRNAGPDNVMELFREELLHASIIPLGHAATYTLLHTSTSCPALHKNFEQNTKK
jgi:hypothetical protein